jgi:serine/threonine protein phosphatase PrpC
MMSQKTSPIPYASELPDIRHQTISLRTQLRLSYETYAWLRYLSWTGLLLSGVLLFLIPGGFPPQAFVQIWQTLPTLGHQTAQSGSAPIFSLAGLIFQALIWSILWTLFIVTCYTLARYSRRLAHTQSLLANEWQPSATLVGRQIQRSEPKSTNQQATASPLRLMRPPEPAQTEPFPHLFTEPSTQVHQFAQPATAPTRPRMPPPGQDPLPNPPQHNWPFLGNTTSTGVAWDTGITRRGRPNEDSVLTLHGTCNFEDRLLPFELHIVADGMGGHSHGRLASHLAIRGMLETVVPGLVASNALESEQIIDILIDGVHWTNQVIYQYGQEQGMEMGTTITCVLLLDETAYIVNVGDSRTYVYRPNVGLTQITRDHSLVARLVETGAIAPDDVYTHPERNKVYRGLGDKMDVTVDWFILPVETGDLLLLCSDGLWEMVRDPRIAEILQTYATAPALASHALLRSALQAGGNDNVSLLVTRVQP